MKRFSNANIVQARLQIGRPNDRYEKEADAVADHVVRMPSSPDMQMKPGTAGPGIQMKCAKCEEEEEKLQMKPAAEGILQMKPGNGGMMASEGLSSRLNHSKNSGQPLPEKVSNEMSGKIGADFSGVKVHTGSDAVQMNRELGAQAFTHGSDIYFNQGKYDTGSSEGKHLLAHELTHVVQQTHQVAQRKTIQRDTLEGTADQCFDYADRDLRTGDSSSTLPPVEDQGGTVIPGSSGMGQNCAGVSLCDRTEWVNWPYLGLEAADGSRPDGRFVGNWDNARYFVPDGCTYVDSAGVGLNATRCFPAEREIIVFLYRWPIGTISGTSVVVYQSDFHMIGRGCANLPTAWESKMDRRERVENIRDPWQSLYDAYPHTRNPNREIVQLVFCCNCDLVSTS